MICQWCGSNQKDTNSYCTQCGATMIISAEQRKALDYLKQENPEAYQAVSSVLQQQTRNKDYGKFVNVVIWAFFAVFLILIWYVSFQEVLYIITR